ncbi:PREDICTED: putative elongator complex protein 1 [Vollenhovia emeryi]|uniref:putative elongator complex protein 1 n=1 Tax=Vollenhovia emeryi TaxID=411798 RepID=UPI0005F50957|nr:PREDICTED: putative elongator complex protein 1 [Vollenhovia emeryi]XP_011876928.1 PREDICTED: putative elongator complex protein 1 [Vollenhovia emeryi]
MKNLAVHEVRRRNLECLRDARINQDLLKSIQCSLNASNNDVYLLVDKYLCAIPFEGQRILDMDHPSKVIALEYCITMQELYCAYESGCITTIDTKDHASIECKVAATFASGLQCMKLSPDHELIVVVTGAGTVATMVLDFQIMSEVNLYSEEFGQNEFVNVGWGKKETQFHGSMGKAAARAKSEQPIPNKYDEGRTRIAWREDGAFFAVNFLDRETKIRKFKIFDREGTLHYTSEQVNGLEEHITWNPCNNLMIAIPQILNDKYVVAFFEKNGLKYSELLLPFKPGEVKVKDLLWSSDILAVVCHEPEASTTQIQLWTESNCHWYLKQTLVFPVDNQLLYATWSNVAETNKKELIYVTTKELTFCSFNWCHSHSRGSTVDDKAVFGVIDGNKILVTAFKDGIVPPPVAHQSIETFESQNAISFAPSKSSSISSSDFCTISCNNRLMFFKKEANSDYVHVNSYSIDFDLRDMQFEEVPCIVSKHINHFLWFTEDIILFSIIIENHSLLCVLSLNEINSKDCLKIQKVHVLDYLIERIVSSPDANAAYIKARDQIFKYTRDGRIEHTNITLSKPCVKMEVIQIDSRDVILALSSDNSFLVDGKESAKNITSFYVHSEFLLLTSLQDTLICVSLNESGVQQLSKHDLTVKPWLDNEVEVFTNIYFRRVEKNSTIVTAIPHDSMVILQMPRGNLEAIHPRPLLLHLVKSCLRNWNYLTALAIMTKHRINLNLIYDHDPQLFLDNVERFINDLVQHNKVIWLNLFLSELQDSDVTDTTYAFCYVDRKSGHTSDKTTVNKVDKICKLLRDTMEKHQNANNLIQPILISLVKNRQRQGLEDALSKIKQIKMLEDSRRMAPHGFTVSAFEALKFLQHFVTFDILYDIALGMYDLELALFIASKSPKDPKEYIPFLNKLKKLDENYMKYTINVHLKRYDSALEYLSKVPGHFEKCLELIRNQQLYKFGMKLFKRNTAEHKMVAEIFGEFLLSENKYPEAGMMFYRSGNLDRAVKTFTMSPDNWEDVIAIAKEMKLSQKNLNQLYQTLVENLKEARKYEPAATILKDYLNDVEDAIALLCEAKLWKYAIRIAIDNQRLDLNETHIKPGLKEHAEHVISQLSEMKRNFLRHKSRLAVVRAEIVTKHTQVFVDKVYKDELQSNKELLDTISDTASIADSTASQLSRLSIHTSKSYRSSKNRRKQERKLFSLKEGSMFEDISLIHALYQLVNCANKNRDEWCQLLQLLIRFEFDESAEKIVVEAKDFFQLVESSKNEIWDKSIPTSFSILEKYGNYSQAQLQEYMGAIKLVERYVICSPELEETPRILTTFF